MAGESPAPNPASKKKRIVIILILIAMGVATKVIFFSKPFRYTGTLEATKVDLSSRLASSLSAVNIQEGEHINVNQDLVILNCDDLKIASDLATANFDRNEKLFKAHIVTPEAMDQIRTKKADADLRMSWCKIQSPITGTVLSRYHEPGEWVTPGTKLVTVADIKNIWAYIYVPQQTVAFLKPGQKLKAYLPEMHDREFEGTILKINAEAEFTPKNVQTEAERARLVFGVKVSFLGVNTEEILKPGMTVEVELPKE